MESAREWITDRDAGKQPEAINYLLDESNNLSVIFAGETPLPAKAACAPAFDDTPTLQHWIDRCSQHIAAPRQAPADSAHEAIRARLLGLFPRHLQFPIGALFDITRRVGGPDSLPLTARMGPESQALVNGILYLCEQLREPVPQDRALPAYTCRESEAIWTCYRNLIQQCAGERPLRVTLADAERTRLPIPTLDLRLIIQNVLYSVLGLDGSTSTPVVLLHNTGHPNGGAPAFCLTIRTRSRQLRHVVSALAARQPRGNGSFVLEGSGIGHVIAARLVENLGGEIVLAESDDAADTTLRVYIPLDRADGPASDSGAGVPAGNTGIRRVLYIEDMRSHVLLVQQIVERLGDIQLSTAANGRTGLELARQERPDLILLDMDLPDIAGLDVFRQLGTDPATAGIPVIALSAAAMPQQISAALALGIRHYLAKPFSCRELMQILREELSLKATLPGL